MKRPEVGYSGKIDKGRVDMSNGIKLKEAEDCGYCLQLLPLNMGLKRTPPPVSLGPF